MSIELRVQDVTFVSATLADFGGLVTGDMINQPTSTGGVAEYMLVKAAGSVPNNRVVKRDTGTTAEVTVIVTTANADIPIAANNTGGTVASGSYFFGKVGPWYNAESDGAATIAPGVSLMPSNIGTNDGRVEAAVLGAGIAAIGVNNTDAAAAVTVLKIIGRLPANKAGA